MNDLNHNTDLVHLRPAHDDEIDLGELVRKLLNEWKLICSITFLGAVLGVVVALMLPKQYRVEAIFERPTTSQIAPLLSQELVELSRQQILGEFLKNLQSRKLLEAALTENNLLVNNKNEPLTAEEKVSAISTISASMRIAPAVYDFLPELEDTAIEFDQISISALSTDRESTRIWLNTLLTIAEEKTLNDLAEDIRGQQSVRIQKLAQQVKTLENAATTEHQAKLSTLADALAIAKTLKLSSPDTSLDLNEEPYAKGSIILEAQLETLNASKPKLKELTVGYEKDKLGNTTPIILSPLPIQGELRSLEELTLDFSAATLLADNVSAQIPANAEKPNRKLIAIAATVLAGFFGLFLALIRIAIKKD